MPINDNSYISIHENEEMALMAVVVVKRVREARQQVNPNGEDEALSGSQGYLHLGGLKSVQIGCLNGSCWLIQTNLSITNNSFKTTIINSKEKQIHRLKYFFYLSKIFSRINSEYKE